jgi:chromosome segregation ATPase
MYKKLKYLKTQLQDEQAALETEVHELETIVNQPEPRPFNELEAASRITKAKSQDHLEGTNTAIAVIKKIDEERAETLQKIELLSAKRAEAKQQLPAKKAQLSSVTNEASRIHWQIKAMIDQEANRRLEQTVNAYQKAANDLLDALVDFDALNAVISDDPHNNFVKKVANVVAIPVLGDNKAEIGSWQLKTTGDAYFVTEQVASQTVRHRYETILEEIKGDLYGQ